MKGNPKRAIGAGFIATLVMTMLAYVAPMMGMPKMDFAAMLGSMFVGEMPAVMSGAWLLGMLIHFIDGTVIFSLIYSNFLYGYLPGSNWLKGVIWGGVLWALSQVIVMPVLGMGLFSANAARTGMVVIGSLIGHLVYGAILGKLAGVQAGKSVEFERHEEAPHQG